MRARFGATRISHLFTADYSLGSLFASDIDEKAQESSEGS